MPAIRITDFGGMRPRDGRYFGAPGRAELARDVKLWHGTLEPWRYPSKDICTGQDKICKMHKQDCCWVVSDNPCANFTRGDTDCNIVYSTEHMPWPAYAILPDDCCDCAVPELEWCRLGIPKPVNEPVVTDLGTLTPPVDGPNDTMWKSDAYEQIKREPRSYIYTFVNELGEESAPSDPSEVFDVDIDSPATIQAIIPALEDGFKVESIRIYRGVPTAGNLGTPGQLDTKTASGGQGPFYQAVESTFLFVGEVPFTEGILTFTDDPPPECLKNLIMTENGTLVGSEGKNVWFSEPWRFHAWSCHLNLDYGVEALGFQDGLIYVATNSYPYIIRQDYGEEDCKCCRDVTMITTKAPITCKRSMVKTPQGFIWATLTGLVKVSGPMLRVDTHNYMAEDDWAKYFPHKIYGEYWKGLYFGFNGSKGFIWDVTDGAHSDQFLGDSTKLVELSLTPDTVYATDQDELYMSFDGDIYRWDSSDTFMPYLWRSQINVEGGLRNYSAMKVVFKDWLRTRKAPNPVNIRFYADDKLVFTRQVNCSRPFRLPKGFDALNFQIEISGIEEVMEVHMATSMQELTLLNNT